MLRKFRRDGRTAPHAGVPPLSDTLLRSDQGSRIESLGDNCELGFVLRRAGHEGGSLFRWTAIGPAQLLLMLRAGLEDFYRFEDLEPLRTAMVRDRRFDVGWHTEMTCRPAGGRMEFVHDAALRRKTHARESRKLRYLVSKFRARARLGGLVHVVKCNAGIAPEVLDGIHECLGAMAEGAPFTLLEIRADPALAGTVQPVRPGLLRGHVPRFAPYAAADTGDDACWTSLLEQALALAPCADWTRRLAGLRVAFAEETVQLAFPPAAAQALDRPIAADGRAGACVLRNGSNWCRPFNGGFRLHGAEPWRRGAELRWTGVWAAGARQLGASLRCAVDDSAPLEAVVTVRDAEDRTLARQALRVSPGRPEEILLDLPAGAALPLDIRVAAAASRLLHPGERCVADLSPPALYPASEKEAPENRAGEEAHAEAASA